MRGRTAVVVAWIVSACSPASESELLRSDMHMVIENRPAAVEASRTSLFRPNQDRTSTDNVATLLRSIDCPDSCYVGVVSSDDATALAFLEALCDRLQEDQLDLGSQVWIDVYLRESHLATGDEVVKKCLSAARDDDVTIGVAFRTE